MGFISLSQQPLAKTSKSWIVSNISDLHIMAQTKVLLIIRIIKPRRLWLIISVCVCVFKCLSTNLD